MDKMILERAQNAMLSRDFGLAARLYKTLLKSEPGNLEILNSLGSLYVKSNEDEKAIPYYESILTFSPHNVDAMNSLGGIYRRLKQYEKGIEVLNRALDENQKTAMINYTLGFTYKDMENYDDAIECFENVVSENPSDVLAYNHLGAIYAIKKNYPKAVQAYRRGLQTDPNHPILQYNLGHAYEAEKNYTEALKCYDLALKAKPGWIDAIRDSVNLLIKCQNTRRALDLIQKSVQLYPTNVELQSLLGSVQMKRYDFAAAQDAFDKADRLKPNDSWILLQKAQSFEKDYRLEEAAAWAKEARVIGLTDINQKKLYVHVMLSAGEMERATAVLEEMEIESPSDTGVLDARAQVNILRKNEAGKEEFFGLISDMNPRYHHHYLEAARRYLQVRNFKAAHEAINKYIEMSPLNPAGYNVQARIFEKEQDLENAIKSYRVAAGMKSEDVFAIKELKRLGVEWNENLQDEVSDYITKLNETEKAQEEARLAEEERAAEKLEEDIIEQPLEEFDFNVMGDDISEDEPVEEVETIEDEEDSVPLLSELSEDEGLKSIGDLLEDEEDNSFDEDIFDEAEEILPEPQEEMPETKSSNQEKSPSKITEPEIAEEVEEEVEEEKDFKRAPKLVDKLGSAVQDLEKAVSQASEKANEAIKKAEEVADRIESKLNEEEAESLDEFPTLGESVPETTSEFNKEPEMSFVEPELSGGFDEPNFEAPFEIKDPFDNPVVPDFSIPSIETDDTSNEMETAAKQALNNARQFLPNIVKIIEDENMSAQYRQELGLFSKLRNLSEFLPPNKREEFLSSKTRMLMDYVIGKMSGKPGLVKTVENLLKSGILETDVTYSEIESEAASLTGNDLARKVISDLKKLTADLPDKHLASALCESADDILKKL